MLRIAPSSAHSPITHRPPLLSTREAGAAPQVRLYAAICHAYDAAKIPDGARLWAARGLTQVERLAAAEARDPVPPPADIRRALAAATLEMRGQKARHAVPGEESGTALLEGLREAAGGDDKALVRAACRALEDPARRTLRHTPAAADEAHRAEVRGGGNGGVRGGGGALRLEPGPAKGGRRARWAAASPPAPLYGPLATTPPAPVSGLGSRRTPNRPSPSPLPTLRFPLPPPYPPP